MYTVLYNLVGRLPDYPTLLTCDIFINLYGYEFEVCTIKDTIKFENQMLEEEQFSQVYSMALLWLRYTLRKYAGMKPRTLAIR